MKKEKGGRNLVIGVKAGYNYSPSMSDWMLDDASLPGGPDVGITGPFVLIMFGGGGGSK